jgi:hypothetical protein
MTPLISRVLAISGAAVSAISIALLWLWSNPLAGAAEGGRSVPIDESIFPAQFFIGLLGIILYTIGVFFLRKNSIKIRPWFLLPTVPLYSVALIHAFFIKDFLEMIFLVGFVFSGILVIWVFIEAARIAAAK